MRSADPDVTVDRVRRLVAAQFPEWEGLRVRPVVPGGWDNRTYASSPSRTSGRPCSPVVLDVSGPSSENAA